MQGDVCKSFFWTNQDREAGKNWHDKSWRVKPATDLMSFSKSPFVHLATMSTGCGCQCQSISMHMFLWVVHDLCCPAMVGETDFYGAEVGSPKKIMHCMHL